ncbi:MAG: F0F1 ATP synthase subunit epsilon [Clostridiales bacterium]|jgi:F-type H+-transporting ATPase subunit epsilon|nr:F0F1 ATP synthase subunit epsilon [Eubacteriales bacterium]MDH7566305.1 F0F1 ATP synthase subunit epsilon [Clostridiales bacterium]
MASTFNLEIVTPERKFFSGDVEMVILKTPEGEMGILKEHMPMVVAVDIGPIQIKKDGKWMQAVLTEGFMEVKQDKTVILTDTAEWPEEIDVNRAEQAKKRAEERLQRQISEIEFIRSRAALARAMARLKVKGKR